MRLEQSLNKLWGNNLCPKCSKTYNARILQLLQRNKGEERSQVLLPVIHPPRDLQDHQNQNLQSTKGKQQRIDKLRNGKKMINFPACIVKIFEKSPSHRSWSLEEKISLNDDLSIFIGPDKILNTGLKHQIHL